MNTKSIKSNSIEAPKPGFIYNLRRAGFKIRVKHFRVAWRAVTPDMVTDSMPGIYLVTQQNRDQYRKIASNGGITELDVTFPDGVTVTGSAVCAIEDTYNKRLGTYIAFRRAVAKRKALTNKA